MLITASKAAQMLGIKTPRLYQLARENIVPYVRLGERQIRFNEDALKEWIEQGGVNGCQPEQVVTPLHGKPLTKPQLQDEMDRLAVVIAVARAERADRRESLNRIRRQAVQVKRERIRQAVGPTQKEHAREGNLLMTRQCRDLCWEHDCNVSNQIIAELISSGRLHGHMYKGTYFATREAVMEWIKRETTSPNPEYYQPDEVDEVNETGTEAHSHLTM